MEIMVDIFINMLTALSLTVVVEVLMALVLKIKEKLDIINVIMINFITNPILNYLVMVVAYLFTNNVIIYIFMFVFEIIVVISEYVFYKKNLKYNKINKLLLSFILNLASVSIGFIILW